MTRITTIALVVWLKMLRRKDMYVLLILLGAMLAVLISLNVFGMGGAVGYVKDAGLLMTWIFSWILAVSVSAKELPQEESQGTIFPLLAKPITRAELLAGKWLGCWAVVTAATLLFYTLVFVVVAAKSGRFQVVSFTQACLLHSAAIGVMCAIGIFFSCRMNHDAAMALTYVLTAAAFVILPRVPEFLAQESGSTAALLMLIYNVLPHFEVFDLRQRLVHNYAPVDWTVIFISLAYGAAVTWFVLTAAWFAYRHRKFVRNALNE